MLVLGKHQDIARSRLLIFLYEGGSHAKATKAQFLLGGVVVLVWWEKTKFGLDVKHEHDLG